MNKLAQTAQMQTIFPQISSMLSQLATMLPELAPQTRTLNLSLMTAQKALQTTPAVAGAPAQNKAAQPEQTEQPETAASTTSNAPAPPAPAYSGGEGLATVEGSGKFRFVYAQQEEEEGEETEASAEQEQQAQPQQISPYDRSIQILEVLSQFDMHTFWGLLQQALDFSDTQPTNPAMMQVKQQIQSYSTALAAYVERLNLLASSPRTAFMA